MRHDLRMSTPSEHPAPVVVRAVVAAAVLQAGLAALVLAAVLHVAHQVALARAGVDAVLGDAPGYLTTDTPWWVVALAVVGVALVAVGAWRLRRTTTGSWFTYAPRR